jgi:hypothetical protein
MLPEATLRIARSPQQLDRLLSKIEAGKLEKPDWIRLEEGCRIAAMKLPERQKFLARIHACVRRGFRDGGPKPRTKEKRLALWQSIARAGFHDFSDFGWMKNYDSPWVENYDYIEAFQKGGLPGLDPYKVYSAVLGTVDFGVRDFVSTKLCRNVRTIVEPMAGTAEFCYFGHFWYPDFRYMMIDLDRDAQRRVLAQRWLPQTSKDYIVGDVLSPSVWERVKAQSTGESLAYIGKQSHHYFDARQLYDLMKLATDHVDYLMLETLQICLVSEMGDTEELGRPEQKDAGFTCALVGEKGGDPNPLTHALSFHLEARQGKNRRTIFNYHGWTSWAHSTLVAFADLLGLHSYYFHAAEEEFVPVAQWDDGADCEENVTFMLFSKRSLER